MQSSLSNQQLHTVPAREIAAPTDCVSFTTEQEAAIEAAFVAWINSGYSVAKGEEYAALRRRFQYANMVNSLRGKS